MDLTNIIQSVEADTTEHSQGSRKSRAGTWNSCKDEIYKVYMIKNNTLSETMKLFEGNHGLIAW